jgi:hypothetical protein
LVVDEAAAIPLPVVKSLLGPYLVFLSSTINGYAVFCFGEIFHMSLTKTFFYEEISPFFNY